MKQKREFIEMNTNVDVEVFMEKARCIIAGKKSFVFLMFLLYSGIIKNETYNES